MNVNPNPIIYDESNCTRYVSDDIDSNNRELIDSIEIYNQIRLITDPEHPFSLEQLRIVCPEDIVVDDAESTVEVVFTPTVPNCSMPAILGLCIRERLLRVLPQRFHSKIFVKVAKGKHDNEHAINRQLRDKERCLAALEKDNVRNIIENCIRFDDSALVGL